MINSRKELDFYIKADRMMNIGSFRLSLYYKMLIFFGLFPIMDWMIVMRKASYYKTQKGMINKIRALYYKYRFTKLSLKLGFTIGMDCFGYGLVVGHYGPIVVGETNRIGNYAVLHTSTCITNNGKVIGDGLYLATGAKITTRVKLGNNISVGANSLVNKDCLEDNVLIAGTPARIIKKTEAWYIRDDWQGRVNEIEKLKADIGL